MKRLGFALLCVCLLAGPGLVWSQGWAGTAGWSSTLQYGPAVLCVRGPGGTDNL